MSACCSALPHRRKTLSLPLGLNEFVDVGLRPITLHTRRRRKTNRLKTPPLLSLLANGLPRDGFGNVLPAGLHDSRVGSPHRNPPLEILDDGRRQSRTVLGHLEILLLVSNRPEATDSSSACRRRAPGRCRRPWPNRPANPAPSRPWPCRCCCGTRNNARRGQVGCFFRKTRPAPPWDLAIKPTAVKPKDSSRHLKS